MMIAQMFTPDPSGDSSIGRSRGRASSLALCALGLLGAVVACEGSIDTQGVASSRPGTGGAGAPGATGTANGAGAIDPSATSSSEQGNVGGISSGSTSSGAARGSSRVVRANPRLDAGADDAGANDAGADDAGAIDAGAVDAGAIDAGAAGR